MCLDKAADSLRLPFRFRYLIYDSMTFSSHFVASLSFERSIWKQTGLELATFWGRFRESAESRTLNQTCFIIKARGERARLSNT